MNPEKRQKATNKKKTIRVEPESYQNRRYILQWLTKKINRQRPTNVFLKKKECQRKNNRRKDGQKAEWTDGHLYKLPVFIALSSFVVEKNIVIKNNNRFFTTTTILLLLLLCENNATDTKMILKKVAITSMRKQVRGDQSET